MLLDTVTSLQPRALLFWAVGSWHMAWNASVAALNDRSQPREALRIRAQREYFKLGEDMLLRGISNNPDRPLLYDRLGMLYNDKFKDHCRAYEAYEKAAQFADAPAYVRRFAAYELSRCPGNERLAYQKLKALYLEGEQERTKTLLERLQSMQEKLDIPAAERVYNPPPQQPEAKPGP